MTYVGGIAARTSSWLNNCLASGEITVTAKTVYAGGVLGAGEVDIQTNIFGSSTVYCGTVYHCISGSKINVTVTDNTPAHIGGIAGYIRQLDIEQQKRDDKGNLLYDDDKNPITYTVYFGGGVTDSYFIGEYRSSASYFGNIVGVCGANIYETNSYTAGNEEYHNFENNVYVSNSMSALGSTITSDGEYVLAADKGATSATLEVIQNSEIYKSILSALES